MHWGGTSLAYFLEVSLSASPVVHRFRSYAFSFSSVLIFSGGGGEGRKEGRKERRTEEDMMVVDVRCEE